VIAVFRLSTIDHRLLRLLPPRKTLQILDLDHDERGTALLLGAALWALGAALLPLLVRGRGPALDVVAATLWSAAIAVATPIFAAGLVHGGAQVAPRGLIAGAVLGGAIAVAARALRGPV